MSTYNPDADEHPAKDVIASFPRVGGDVVTSHHALDKAIGDFLTEVGSNVMIDVVGPSAANTFPSETTKEYMLPN